MGHFSSHVQRGLHISKPFFLGHLDVEQFLVALYCAKLRRPRSSRSEAVDEIMGWQSKLRVFYFDHFDQPP